MKWGFKILIGLMMASSAVEAQDFLKNLLTKAPGPLSKPHKEWDTVQGCINCHVKRLGGDVDNTKCLTCHPDIEERIQKKIGFHKDKAECQECHAEHREPKKVVFAPKNWMDTFKHGDTDYELFGKHTEVKCQECHTKTRQNWKTKTPTTTMSYLGASTKCYDCHRDVYEHDFSKDEWLNCTDCHSSEITSWKKLARKPKFNHDKTDYPLEGLHQKVNCTSCHQPDEKRRRVTSFNPLEFSNCTSCHYDVHEGKFSQNCESCHSVYRPWEKIQRQKTEAPAKPDGTKTAKAAKPAKEKDFDHSATKFPLIGHHEAVDCEYCHYDPNANFKIAADKFDQCSDCHGMQHGKQFANQECTDCHKMEKRWFETSFGAEQHQKTKFVLSGKHQILDCNKCHFDGVFEGLKSETCSDCHRNPHDVRQIDKDCSSCHVTTTFSWIDFDHNQKTNFKLTGQHREVACLSCHVDEVFKNMPASNDKPACQNCHADPHGPKMSNDCQDCHATEGFKLVKEFKHGELFKFNLDGRHSELTCQKCHANHLRGDYTIPVNTKAVKAAECANCHVDVHKNKYGTACATCHTTQTFSVEYGEKVHDLGFFKLQGTHDRLGCTECHRPDTKLAGTGIDCAWCHKKDDIHLGKMGAECGDCHGQTAWLPTNFKHTTTGFRLSGAHRYVECSSCHVNQIYQGLPSDCYFCHSDSFVTGTTNTNFAHGVGIMECSDCHSTLSWKIRKGAGIKSP